VNEEYVHEVSVIEAARMDYDPQSATTDSVPHYTVRQGPVPHIGTVPPWHAGTSCDLVPLCAAGTLSSRSSFTAPQFGQTGCSLDRTSNSNSRWHSPHAYS